ncbi:hypothetical protein CVIRNUC_005384 [Coccomyxa viridis]|uniref:Protein kinase domain-containing protein n=1 Tax=Coccomyxa viridis TaxID=1274662 RepID=A0AAV1I4A1_9CHLO|nr:hypothetical protein CVIRNUC_005384 [Coccomyxa viridis]
MALARPGQQISLLPSLLSHYNSLHGRGLRHSTVAHAATRQRGIALPGGLDSLGRIGNVVADEPISLQELRVRDVKEVSYVSRRRLTDDVGFDPDAVDEEGLPLVYNEAKITEFWRDRWGELASRWTTFAGITIPWLSRLATAVLRGRLEQEQVQLAKDAVRNFERLGATYIKIGQVLSVRPDVLPVPVMQELARLQDNITPFDTTAARAVVETDLGQPIDAIFSEFSERPIAAASLAQVYRARLRATGEEVAVKVQRPDALSTISKDLYVMRRAVVVYERLIRRFTAQTTDYQVLLSTFAEGLYTEMDFRNEGLNMLKMQEVLDASEFFDSSEIVIPKPFMPLSSRRVLVMEFIRGQKLASLPRAEIRALVEVGQTAFLVQLLDVGYLHADPHPGNLMKVTEGPNAGKLALLDFGLVAEVPAADREAMVSATIHLGNRDWNALIDDFIALGFLPGGSDRGRIIPVMDTVLSPYLRGGGAKAFNFQMLSQDLLNASLQIPFSVPPYMSLLARAVATLEGIALSGNPDYQMVAEAYPFVVRKVLRNSSSGSRMLLRDIVFDANGKVKPTRMSAILNAALGHVAEQTDGFVDFDAVPAEGAPLQDVLAFLLSPEARDLRPLLLQELVDGLELLGRDQLRRAYARLPTLAPRLPFLPALPAPPQPPVFVPGRGFMGLHEFVETAAPPLTRAEEIYLQSLTELARSLTGFDVSDLAPTMILQMVLTPSQQARELQGALSSASGIPGSSGVIAQMSRKAVDALAERFALRFGLSSDVLFPAMPALRSMLPSAL